MKLVLVHAKKISFRLNWSKKISKTKFILRPSLTDIKENSGKRVRKIVKIDLQGVLLRLLKRYLRNLRK